MPEPTISFTPALARKFQIAYNYAVEKKREYFTFSDNEFYTPYAKYILEHLKNLKLL